MEGENLSLSCPVTNADKTNVDWKNPEGFVMFFNHNQGENGIFSHSNECKNKNLKSGKCLGQNSNNLW